MLCADCLSGSAFNARTSGHPANLKLWKHREWFSFVLKLLGDAHSPKNLRFELRLSNEFWLVLPPNHQLLSKLSRTDFLSQSWCKPTNEPRGSDVWFLQPTTAENQVEMLWVEYVDPQIVWTRYWQSRERALFVLTQRKGADICQLPEVSINNPTDLNVPLLNTGRIRQKPGYYRSHVQKNIVRVMHAFITANLFHEQVWSHNRLNSVVSQFASQMCTTFSWGSILPDKGAADIGNRK